jgi:hypothetical protein
MSTRTAAAISTLLKWRCTARERAYVCSLIPFSASTRTRRFPAVSHLRLEKVDPGKRANSAQISPAGTLCFDIFSPPPGDGDAISQVERLSSNETKIAPRLLRRRSALRLDPL